MARNAWTRSLSFAILAALASTPAAAHPLTYTGSSGAVLPATGGLSFCSAPLLSQVGGVCFDGGHVGPAGSPGSASLAITDNGILFVSAVYCQDLDDDGVCGETAATEPSKHFCASTVITAPSEWTPSMMIIVIVDGPIGGNPATSPCGEFSIGTTGTVFHS